MAQLTESNWKENFENVISNCKSKGSQLENMACKKSGMDMVNTYKKFEKDASQKYGQYQSMPFEKSKRSIGEDMSFFQQQCNSNFTLISNFLKTQCKSFFLNNNLIFLTALLVTGIILIVVGNLLKNNTAKIILNVIGGILLFFVFIKFMIKFLQDFGYIENSLI